MKTVDLIIDDKIKYPPDKETSAKTFRAGARCFMDVLFAIPAVRLSKPTKDFYSSSIRLSIYGSTTSTNSSFLSHHSSALLSLR